jgi:hypothetical protein
MNGGISGDRTHMDFIGAWRRWVKATSPWETSQGS